MTMGILANVKEAHRILEEARMTLTKMHNTNGINHSAARAACVSALGHLGLAEISARNAIGALARVKQFREEDAQND